MASLFKRAGGGGGADSAPDYTPPPSVGHEIGVMMGGFGAMLIGSLLFLLWWRYAMRREAKIEADRVDDLQRRGLIDALNDKVSGGAYLDEATTNGAGVHNEKANGAHREAI